MELGFQILQFVLSISILVILHELGHFIPAKLFKTKVEKFYLFFDPWFSVAKKKIGETEYGIGWLPLGGYVKIAGMIDESMDTEQMKQPAQPWEFRSKPAWQRLIIMLGGVTVNFFLAWLIYSAIVFTQGENYHSLGKMKGGLAVSEVGQKMGLQTGDVLLKIDGKEIDMFENASINLLFCNHFTVNRNGAVQTINLNEDGVAEIIKANEAKAFISPRTMSKIDSIVPNSAAQKLGLLRGDEITSIGSTATIYNDQISKELQINKNKETSIEVNRNGQKVSYKTVIPATGKLGISFNSKDILASLQKSEINKTYGLLASIPKGFDNTINSLVMQVKQFKIIFNTKTKGYKKVSGPIGIIKQMPKEINWLQFWSFTAMFSVWLAFLNLLPIPGLDGGHVVFTSWELITGKPVPQKVLENAQMVGVIFLMGLMALIFGSDIVKAITGKF